MPAVYRLNLIALILTLLGVNSHAATIPVTSNANSGPGTLREAILTANANGTTVFDTITFNLTDQSQAGRTILLLSELPVLRSKIVIDGTTQPGTSFGISDSRIIISLSAPPSNFDGIFLLHNCSQVEIYGLYFLDIHYNGIGTAISTFNCQDIIIGKPGRGNFFADTEVGIATSWRMRSYPFNYQGFSNNLKIQSNILGLTADGMAMVGNGVSIQLYNALNLTIGGVTPAEGNTMTVNNYFSLMVTTDSLLSANNCRVMNNTFGSNYTRTTPLVFSGIKFFGSLNDPTSYTVEDNYFENIAYPGSNSPTTDISFIMKTGFIKARANVFHPLTAYLTGFAGGSRTGTCIFLSDCENGIIGGHQTGDTNYIAGGFYNGVSLYNNRNIEITANSFYCNRTGIVATSSKVNIPEVKILTENGVDQVGGTATPNCRIEVFQTPECVGCHNGRIYMGETLSDAGGNWSFTGAFSSAVSATATSAAGVTGEFAAPEFVQGQDIRSPICGQNNGYIKGTQFVSGTSYYWIHQYNGNEDTIYNQLDLVDIGPGLYQFVVEQTKYCKKIFQIGLTDQTVSVNAQNAIITHPSCGRINGKIEQVYPGGPYDKIYWLNETRDTVSFSNTLLNAGPGNYKFFAFNRQYGCGDSTNWITLVNQAGPSFDLSGVSVTNATCRNSNGNITGVSVGNITGTPRYFWIDSLNQIVGNTADLINVPPGKYKLKFKDNSPCDTLYTGIYQVTGVGMITIDSSQLSVSPAGCTVSNGHIDNLVISGANSYQWTSWPGLMPVGNGVSVAGLSAGAYVLTASNSAGCSEQTHIIGIPVSTFSDPGITQVQANGPNCNQQNGNITVQGFAADPSSYSFTWIDSTSGLPIGTGTSIQNLGVGNYYLFATDSNGCEKKIYTASLFETALPVFNFTGMKISPDECGLSGGSITGITLANLTQPATYNWIDLNNNTLGNQIDLPGIGEGQYRIAVSDASGCTIQSDWLTVSNTNKALAPPVYQQQVILKNTSATLEPASLLPGEFHLFSDPAASNELEQNSSGVFVTPLLTADTYFYIIRQWGDCSSPLVPVQVKVVDKTGIYVPTAFSPNNDGKNDLFRVIAYGPVELEYLSVYNRWGQRVFTSNSLSQGWDGFFLGTKQDSGVYVWMVRAKDLLTGQIIEQTGTVTLIR